MDAAGGRHRSTHARTAGSDTTKRAPPPRRSSTHALPPMAVGVLAHQRQSQPRAHPAAGLRPPVEALEDVVPLARRHARTGVLDHQAQGVAVAVFEGDAGRPVGVVPGVVEQVDDDALQAALVEQHRDLGPPAGVVRHLAVAVAGRDALDRVGGHHRFLVGLVDSGVEPGQLEEIEHHLVEAVDLVDDHVERLLAAVGQLVAPAVEHLDGGRERGDGGAQLVADVGREPRLALDAVLDGVGHVVERADEPVEVRVALGVESGVEAARGELAGGVRHPRDGTEQAAAGRPSDGGGEHRGRRAPEDERPADHPEAAGERGQREHLEVLDVELGDVDADRQVRLAVEDETLPARVAVEDVTDAGPPAVG